MSHRLVSLLGLLLFVSSTTSAWVAAPPPVSTNTRQTVTQLQASSSSSSSRADFLKTVVVATAGGWMGTTISYGGFSSSSASAAVVQTLDNGVTYEVLKKGDGPKPEIGELIAIRFAAYNGPIKIDDIFDTPEPYYTRLGSGGLIKGVEQTLPLMRLGDRWKLTIPGKLAFGDKGRPASAGKPRIPGNAEIVFDVEIVGLPGKEPELIELIGNV